MANQNDKLLGRLLEHAKNTNDHFDLIRKDLEEIKKDIKTLSQFRLKFMGFSACVLILIEVFFEVIK